MRGSFGMLSFRRLQVKSQYFGDVRDFHKYNLLLDLIGGYRQLTNVVMLTPNDETKEGKKRGYEQGELRADVYDFLRTHDRNIAHLPKLFAGRSFTYNHYDKPFTYKGRDAYFASIPEGWLKDAVVFCDPDIGLEDERAYTQKAPTKYVWFKEAAGLWERMQDSCLVVYQHLTLDANKRDKQVAAKTDRLQTELKTDVSAMRYGDIAFLTAKAKT
jgi:hypothetical protein